MKLLKKGIQFLNRLEESLDEDFRSTEEYLAATLGKKLCHRLRPLAVTEFDLTPELLRSAYYGARMIHPIGPIIQTEVLAKVPRLGLSAGDQQLLDLTASAKVMLECIQGLQNEPLPEPEDPVLGVCLVTFHHKRGVQTERVFPTTALSEELRSAVSRHAMPDSSHNQVEDFNYFNLQEGQQLVYGVSYFKQVKVSEEMRRANPELTRSHLQIAIVVLSRVPLFGYLKMHVSSAAKMFFLEADPALLLQELYSSLTAHLLERRAHTEVSEFYLGTDLKQIVGLVGIKNVLLLFKAVLVGRRVLVYSPSSSAVSTFLISLLTLLPGQIYFDYCSKALRPQLWELREYGLPLRLFNLSTYPLLLSMGIHDLALLEKKPSFLAGTTNLLLRDMPSLNIDLTLDLDTCTLKKSKAFEDYSLRYEKRVLEDLEEAAESKSETGFWGSDDWIREQFHNLLKNNLADIARYKKYYSQFWQQCQHFFKQKKDKARQSHDTFFGDSLQPPRPKHDFQKVPFLKHLHFSTFQLFLAFHNESLSCKNEKEEGGRLQVLIEGRSVVLSRHSKGELRRRPYAAVSLNEGHSLQIVPEN